MNNTDIDYIFNLLRKQSIQIRPGLSREAIETIQDVLGAQFPPDLGDLLMAGVPAGQSGGASFPDWSRNPQQVAAEYKSIIMDSFRYDIINNDFWHDIFGDKPDDKRQAADKAVQNFDKIPMPIRVYAHRYIATSPHEAGNPVLSFVQPTDVIYYGLNLKDYFEHEFDDKELDPLLSSYKSVPFWSDLL